VRVVREFGLFLRRLRDQFEGVIWRFRTGAQRREMPGEFGPWPTVYGRFRVWRNAGVFTALLEGLIAEAARRGRTDLSLVSVDSTTARAHHDAAGILIGKGIMEGLEEAAAEQEMARQKEAARRNRTGRTAETSLSGKNVGASAVDTDSV
jgi:transposase